MSIASVTIDWPESARLTFPVLRIYIENQEKHHRQESFQDEFRRWLRQDGLD